MKKWAAFIILLAGCTAPYRVQTSVSPSLDPCRHKIYSFLEPEDKTLTHWLSDPKHRKALNNLLRESLQSRGLTEASAGIPADIWVRQHLESSYNNPTQTAEGVVMANDYKLARWKVELVEEKDSDPVWAMQMDTIIGDLEGQNLSRAREGLRNAFSAYPDCKLKPSD